MTFPISGFEGGARWGEGGGRAPAPSPGARSGGEGRVTGVERRGAREAVAGKGVGASGQTRNPLFALMQFLL